MATKLLDPTLDIVFKLLMVRKQELLRDMIESVVTLPSPISELEIQNPQIPKGFTWPAKTEPGEH